MKKAVFPRFAALFFLYMCVLLVIVMIQFSKRGSFTHRMGNLIVTGNYAAQDNSTVMRAEAGQQAGAGGEYSLAGEASVIFGGLEFLLSGEDGFILEKLDGQRVNIDPEAMTTTKESAKFYFEGGFSVEFATAYHDGNQELSIFGDFPDDALKMELPFKPYRSSRFSDSGDFAVTSSGRRYTFRNSVVDQEKRHIVLTSGNTVANYSVIPERKTFNPRDYTLSEARDQRGFNSAVQRWQDQVFSHWSRIVTSNPPEELVTAYLGEAVRRGVYKSAITAIPDLFIDGNRRTHQSTVYLGRLDAGWRSLASSDREFLSKVSQLIKEKSPEILRESHLFYNLAIRGHSAQVFFDNATELVSSLPPPSLTLSLVPGIFEGWKDWNTIFPKQANPFEHLLDQAWFLVHTSIRKAKSGDTVLVVNDKDADIRFNLLLGHSLASYAAEAGKQDWMEVGRSIVLSVLNLGSDTVPARLSFNEDGSLEPAEGSVTTAQLYNLFSPGVYCARPLGIGAAANGIWAFTAASDVSSREGGNALNISVSFPAGETHYMIIRGIRPFSKIQLYDMDYRTDPQFERYDSSGWAYIRAEQILIVKMRHRVNNEFVRIFFSEDEAL